MKTMAENKDIWILPILVDLKCSHLLTPPSL